MVLTYICWGYAHDEAIIRAFKELGMEILTVRMDNSEMRDREKLQQKLRDAVGDIVFSVNFHAEISDFCQSIMVPYCTWVLQLPNYDLYTEPVGNPCNYIGICDSYLVEKMWSIGIEKVFFLPDAVENVNMEKTTPKCREACFVSPQPEILLKTDDMPLYSKGYMEAFIHAQRVLLGNYILENGLLDKVQKEVFASHFVPENILPAFRKLYLADYYMAPACTVSQQNIFLQNYDSVMTIYSNGTFANCKCEKYPLLLDEAVKNRLYLEKEFTVVLAPHSLHNGIPRQALEVIGAGGFPLCAMQKDYSYFFKNGENIACFQTSAEFNDLLVTYGNSKEERDRVREAAVEMVAKHHTYRNRMEFMLEMWGKY